MVDDPEFESLDTEMQQSITEETGVSWNAIKELLLVMLYA